MDPVLVPMPCGGNEGWLPMSIRFYLYLLIQAYYTYYTSLECRGVYPSHRYDSTGHMHAIQFFFFLGLVDRKGRDIVLFNPSNKLNH